MKYFLDTEFLEDGETITLISIAFVSEDGRELYLINRDASLWDCKDEPWLIENVLAKLPVVIGQGEPHWDNRHRDYREYVFDPNAIRKMIENYFAGDRNIELWATYGGYDYVLLRQLWGRMMDGPDWLPMYVNDLQQLLRSFVINPASMPYQDEATRHHALHDARHLKKCYEAAVGIIQRRMLSGQEQRRP